MLKCFSGVSIPKATQSRDDSKPHIFLYFASVVYQFLRLLKD